jgi:hypothetical protein
LQRGLLRQHFFFALSEANSDGFTSY